MSNDDLSDLHLIVVLVIHVRVTKLDISVTPITPTTGVTTKDGTTIVMTPTLYKFTIPATPTVQVAIKSGAIYTVIPVSTIITLIGHTNG